MVHLQAHIKNIQHKQCDFAKTAGISPSYLSLLLSGRKRPSLELAVRIERVTGGAVPATSWIDDAPTGSASQ